ncbi:MAG: ABC-2 type transport system ATP-binding protein [Myxococcota bacterium]|jgi:ABC-2 type transport system ATP-binding protein
MIEVQSLSRFYGDHAAVKDVSFSIAENEVVGFLGLNGAGKSTTLKVIAGLIPPSSGTVIVDGVDVTLAHVSSRARIGYLPEEPPLYKEMTVTEFLTFLGQLRGMSTAKLRERLPHVIATCQLEGVEHRVIGELSHGYKKRVGIAQAIIHQPRLVILDEPISGLDPRQISEMRAVIRGLAAEATVLVSSHILSEISQTCDRLLVLNEGRLVAQGTEAELAGAQQASVDLRITLRGTPDAITAVLAASEVVTEHRVVPGEGGLAEAHVSLASDERESLVAAFVAAGIGIRLIARERSELEQIFLNLTERTA